VPPRRRAADLPITGARFHRSAQACGNRKGRGPTLRRPRPLSHVRRISENSMPSLSVRCLPTVERRASSSTLTSCLISPPHARSPSGPAGAENSLARNHQRLSPHPLTVTSARGSAHSSRTTTAVMCSRGAYVEVSACEDVRAASAKHGLGWMERSEPPRSRSWREVRLRVVASHLAGCPGHAPGKP
jgi:hypothetical protein